MTCRWKGFNSIVHYCNSSIVCTGIQGERCSMVSFSKHQVLLHASTQINDVQCKHISSVLSFKGNLWFANAGCCNMISWMSLMIKWPVSTIVKIIYRCYLPTASWFPKLNLKSRTYIQDLSSGARCECISSRECISNWFQRFQRDLNLCYTMGIENNNPSLK